MSPAKFVYVTYIRCTPDQLWAALTQPELNRRYWLGAAQESSWQAGADWKIVFADGRIADTGTVLEIDPPRRLLLAWRNEFMPALKAEGYSRASFTLEPVGEVVKLTVEHCMEQEGTKFIEAVSGGWPIILSGLKTLLETGQDLPSVR